MGTKQHKPLLRCLQFDEIVAFKYIGVCGYCGS